LLAEQKTENDEIISLATAGKEVEELLCKEWLLTNTRGSYSSSTVIGCNTRRYHGLLVGSMNPPANRIMALSNLLELLICEGEIYNLSTFEFNEKLNPAGFKHIKQFRHDTGVHFEYQLNGLELTKDIYLLRNDDVILVRYSFKNVERPSDFVIRPFVGLRDFHSLQKSYAPLCSAQLGENLFVCHDVPHSCEMLLNCPGMVFEKDPQWWFNFVYRQDRDRGQDFVEDLWAPGFYKCSLSVRQVGIEAPHEIVFKASLSQSSNTGAPGQLAKVNIERVTDELNNAQRTIVANIETGDETTRRLFLAADAFICRRRSDGSYRTTLLAGYPWFFDWGRDAFIALPGLLLATGRFEEAKSVLTTFAHAADEGMIPNRFDDRSDTAYFNSVDASLWFINAAFEYLKVTVDGTTFTDELLPTIHQIIEAYRQGTRFDIRADIDGLITAGNEQTQLTWMDAKCGGVAFTPRYGKAVEVNALWFNSLCRLAKFYATWDTEKADRFDVMAEKAGASFCNLFWNKQAGCLNDCVHPDSSVDNSCRPNQIFAVSMEFSPLPLEQQRQVVDVVQQKLLTPFGLRSLSFDDDRYKGRYIGNQQQRDGSYHQGTVWAWLIGPFIEAYLKVNDFSPQSRAKAKEFVEPLIEHLTKDGCLGSISEIFDGDSPHEPRGCFAQAWSVAELIRAIQLIKS
jgi:predicted glycogen debranching enzyme